MKILYITDTHIDANGPSSRADNYFETCIAKLTEVWQYAAANNIKVILHGGDFFDTPKLNYKTLIPAMKIIHDSESAGIHWYINVGNHDLYGWNPDTYPRTALKVLSYLPNVTVLPDRALCSIHDGKGEHQNIKIFSIWSKFDREGDPKAFEIDVSDKDVMTYIIVMAHTMLVEKTFISAHVPMGNINLSATGDLIFGSHYHPGWKTRIEKIPLAGGRWNEVVFAHPAALMRTVKSDPQYVYQPAFIVVEIKDDNAPEPECSSERLISIDTIPLKCAVPYPFKEDAATIPERDLQYAPKFDAFMNELVGTEFNIEEEDPRTIAVKFAQEIGIPEGALKRVISNLDASRKE